MTGMRRIGIILLLSALFAPGLEGAIQRPSAEAGTGWLGVNVTELRRTSSEAGVTRFESRFLVDAVEPNSGAERAGILARDEILRIDGQALGPGAIQRLARTLRPGQIIRFEVLRGESVEVVDVRAGERPAHRVRADASEFTGQVWAPIPNSDTGLGEAVRDLAETREFTILFRMDSDGRQGWSYTFEPETGAMDFDMYAVRTSELDSTVVSLERLTEDMNALRIERLAGMRDEPRLAAEPEVPMSMRIRLRELQDEMAVMSLRSLPPEWTPRERVFRVRVPRARAITPYLSVGSYLLGARVQDMDQSLARYFSVQEGVLVADVVAGTPAAEAGILAGDVIVEVNDQIIRTRNDLQKAVSDVSGRMAITVVRRGTRIELELSQ